MHQSPTLSLSQTIWPRWPSRQFLILPIVQTLLTVTFPNSLSSEASVMRQLRRWKRMWRRSLTRSLKRTSWGLPVIVGTVKQVYCSRRRLLRRGLEFHVCTINKSAHTKNCLETYSAIIYIYIWKQQPKLNRINFQTSANVFKCLWLLRQFIEPISKSSKVHTKIDHFCNTQPVDDGPKLGRKNLGNN